MKQSDLSNLKSLPVWVLAATLLINSAPACLAAPSALAVRPSGQSHAAHTPQDAVVFEAQDTPLQIVHHGAEGGGEVGTLGVTAASQITSASLSAKVDYNSVTESLWGNLLLSMAYQRDPELQKLVKKLNRVNTFTLASVAGVSALGLAQSINALSNTGPQTINITPAHHPGGHDHVHVPAESKTPSTLGIIGSGATLVTLGIRTVLNKRYNSKLAKRQAQIQHRIAEILSLMENGNRSAAQHQLTGLVGARATGEFLQIWDATHPVRRPGHD